MLNAWKMSRGLAATAIVLASGALFSPTYAQVPQSDGGGNVLQEVIVTAQKVAQNMQDIGTSITAISGNEIAKLGLTNTVAIAQQVPSLEIEHIGSWLTVLDVRGLSQNDFTDYEEPPVALYEDGAYRAVLSEQNVPLYDLERVEVERGPQGTLFGRNATGGLVQYISKQPTDTFEGYASATAGSFGEIDTQGAVSGPVGRAVDARLAFATEQNEGYVRNLLGGPNLNNERVYSGRLQFLFKLGDAGRVFAKFFVVSNPHLNGTGFTWSATYPDPVTGLGHFLPANVNYWGPYFANLSTAPASAGGFGLPVNIFANFPGCPGCDSIEYRKTIGGPFDQPINQPEDFRRLMYGTTEHVNWRFPHGVEFTSVTDFLHLNKEYEDGEDDTPIGPLFTTHIWQSFRQFSEELRLNGRNGPFKWIGGLYFLDMNSRDYYYVPVLPISGFGASSYLQYIGAAPPGPPTSPGLIGGTPGNVYDVKTYSEAAFAQGEWSLTDRLTAIAGVRETRDEKLDSLGVYDGGSLAYGGTPFMLGAPPDFVFNPATSSAADQVKTLPSLKLELDGHLTRQAMVYASMNRGVKSGGFNEPYLATLPIPAGALVFRPETLVDYELGEKVTFWDGRARLNSDVFFYDYRNYQSYSLVYAIPVVSNYDARDKGGELELTVLPLEGLELAVGVSGLGTRVENVVSPIGFVFPTRQLPLAPKWSGNFLARYTWHAWNSAWWVQADGKAQTSEYFEAYNAPDDYDPGRLVANVSIGYTDPTGQLDVKAFCRNVGDKLYYAYFADASSLGYGAGIYAPPRWYGATVTYHF